MLRFATYILLLLVSFDLLAQNDSIVIQPIKPEGIFTSIDTFNERFWGLLVNAFNNEYVNFWVSNTVYVTGFFYVFRSMLDYRFKKINLEELAVSRFLFLITIFWFSVPSNFLFVMAVISDTAFSVARALQIGVFGGEGEWWRLVKIVFLLVRNINFNGEAVGIFSITIGFLVGLLVVLFFVKDVIFKIIHTMGLMGFAYLGFDVLVMVGYVIIPLFLIQELKFLGIGFLRSVVFLFVFVLVLKSLILIGAVLIIYAFLGNSLFYLLQYTGNIDYLFYDFEHLLPFTMQVGGFFDYLGLFFFVAMGFGMILSAIPITMFIVTGLGGGLSNATSTQKV